MSTSNSVCSRQTALIFSLQNMQYVQWHLQAEFKKRKNINLKGKKKLSVQKCLLKLRAQTQNINRINSINIKWLSSGVMCRFQVSITLPKGTNLLLLCFVDICGS